MKKLFKQYYMIISLFIFAVVAATILSYVYTLTYPAIQLAYKKDFVTGLDKVLPSYTNDPYNENYLVADRTIYPAKNAQGEILGYALASSTSKGYGGVIDILMGVSPEGKIIGVTIIKHSETPGLGANILKDKFLTSFKGLADETKVKIKKDGGDVEQISGASISPRAVSSAVVDGLQFVKNNILVGAK